MSYLKNGKDVDGCGRYEIESFGFGSIWFETSIKEDGVTRDILLELNPEKARKLAKRLKKAADHAEGIA